MGFSRKSALLPGRFIGILVFGTVFRFSIRFSGKTLFYTIGPCVSGRRGVPRRQVSGRGSLEGERGGHAGRRVDARHHRQTAGDASAGGNCIKMGLPGKLILSKRKGLWEVLGPDREAKFLA